MKRAFREWFVAERSKALALVLLTRRNDLIVKETKEENGLDFTVYFKSAGNLATQPFGVCLAADMTPVTLEEAGKQLRPVLEKVRASGPFHFPVCVFYFTVKDDQGYFAWAFEPVVAAELQPRLVGHLQANCGKLGNETLDEIVSAVKRWYEVFDATITSLGNGHQPERDANPEFASLADEFESRVRGASLSTATDMTLVIRCVDEAGRNLPPVRMSIVPQTTLRGFGAAGSAATAALHRDAILANIDSLVRRAPLGLTMLRDAPRIPVRIVGFELEIRDSDAPTEGRKRLKVGKA